QVVEQDGPVTGVGLRQSSGNLLEVRTNTPVGHSASGQHPNVRGHLGGHLADAFGEPGAVGNDYQANSHERDLADSAKEDNSRAVERAPGSRCPALRSPK